MCNQVSVPRSLSYRDSGSAVCVSTWLSPVPRMSRVTKQTWGATPPTPSAPPSPLRVLPPPAPSPMLSAGPLSTCVRRARVALSLKAPSKEEWAVTGVRVEMGRADSGRGTSGRPGRLHQRRRLLPAGLRMPSHRTVAPERHRHSRGGNIVAQRKPLCDPETGSRFPGYQQHPQLRSAGPGHPCEVAEAGITFPLYA